LRQGRHRLRRMAAAAAFRERGLEPAQASEQLLTLEEVQQLAQARFVIEPLLSRAFVVFFTWPA
jgi:hypothetical protein